MQLFSSFPWMRRFASAFAILSVALVLMVPLAACGGGSGSGTTSTGPVNLTFWSWVSVDKSVALWNQTHPNIHVTWSNVGSGPIEYNKLFTAIKANNEPDVGQIEFQVTPQFETTAALVDLSPYGASSLKNQFASWTWNQIVPRQCDLWYPWRYRSTGPVLPGRSLHEVSYPRTHYLGAVCRRCRETACSQSNFVHHRL